MIPISERCNNKTVWMEVLYFLQWYWRPGTVVMYSVWKARLIQRVDCRRENAGKCFPNILNGCHSDAHASSFKSRPGEGVIETMTRPKKKNSFTKHCLPLSPTPKELLLGLPWTFFGRSSK